jgi:hemolysin activation/secretion protein
MPFWLLAAAAAVQLQPGNNPIVRDRLDQQPPVPKVVPQKRRGTTSVQAAGSQQPIRTIVFQGVQAPAEVAEAAKAFLGRPATRASLVELAGALSRAYERTDIALYTVAIPDQNFRDGVVVVELVEGWVNAVQIKAAQGRRFPLLEARAEKLVGEKPLSRSLYERQAALMQSIPGLKLDASFENPEGDDSVAFVLTPRQKRNEGAVGIDNRGPHLLGDLVLQGGLDYYRLLTDGDQLSFSGYATPDFRHYRALDAAYALPIGSEGLTLTTSTAWIATRLRHLDIHGEAKFAGMALTYPILRQARRAADISVGVDGVNSDNALFGNVFATERSRAARLAGALVIASERDNLQLSAAVSHGLGIFGANGGDTGAEIKFTKLNGSATYEHQLVPRLFGRINVTGQYSRDRLPAAELMAVGGAVIGRAFDTGILTGDRGIGGFAELAYRPMKAGNFQQSEAYLFGDAASLRVNRRPAFPGQSFSLASAGAGVRVKYKKRIQLGLEAAAVLDRPYPGYRKNTRLSFYYTILF